MSNYHSDLRKGAPAELVTRILDATEAFDVAACDRSIAEAFSSLDPVTLAREVLGPVLRTAGDRWHQGRISVVQEHLLSGSVRRRLYTALDQYNYNATGSKMAFTTLSGERHELGALICAVIAASRGFHCVHLGPDLPPDQIALFCARVKIAAVVLSVVTHPVVIDGPGQLSTLRQLLPAEAELWIGGTGAARIRPEQVPDRCFLMKDLSDFIERLPVLSAPPDERRP